MTPAQIKDNAPEGATHYAYWDGELVYFAKCYNDCCWLDFYNGVLASSESPILYLHDHEFKPLY